MLYKLASYKKSNEDAMITAAGIDFSKPIDEQGNTEAFDPKKEITIF